ncbi:MAG: TRAP transporter large permease subunit [Desulfarculus sp.]|jgi:tripartite ATP-independent transporter DctM subunit|nr:MAG: TRAP transporter large permease subunit [Desulfarculus sp.]
MSIELITILIFALLIVLLLSGLPLAFGFGAAMVILTLWQMGPQGLYIIVTTANSDWNSYILLAIPLFVLMAKFLQHSGLAEKVYSSMYKWMGGLPGGLAMGTVFVCAIFAAMSGISGAATVAMGLIALPSMLKRNYDKRMAVGTVAAGGSLGILIPPSIIMVVYASLTNESVGKLFMAGIIPGIILTIVYILQVGILCRLRPHYGPPIPENERASLKEKIVSLKAIILPLLMILVVLGFIYFGVCTPTEAAGIGAFAAFIITIIQGRMTKEVFFKSLKETLMISVMIMWIVLGAKCFVHIYSATGASDFVGDLMSGLPLNKWFIVIIMQFIILFLGMFIDPIGIMMICVPVFLPIIESFGMSPIWFGVLFTINLEMAYITPPFGLNLFYLKSILPSDVTMEDMYRSIVPFVLRDMAVLAMVMIFPQLALWLPEHMH